MVRLLALIFIVCLAAGCGGNDAADEAGTTTTAPAEASGPLAAADLTGVKSYLTEHTDQLVDFTERFRSLAQDYDKLAAGVDYDHARLLSEHRGEVVPLLAKAKDLWTEGNPYYERMEGIVAGTPSLAEYDIIIDAGSSKAEDPESAVPFDLELADGRVLEQPGNLYNLTEGMLWGTRPEYTADVKADLDADGKVAFGEALPDARVFTAAAAAFDRYARELSTKAQGLAADPVGRVHGAGGDGAHHERVLRPVEGVALRPRRRVDRRLVQRRLPAVGHRRHHRRARSRLRRRRARRSPRSTRQVPPRRAASSPASPRSSPTCAHRSRPATASRPSRQTSSASRRRSAAVPSPARSRSTPPNSLSNIQQ